jgi:hypothetical protein
LKSGSSSSSLVGNHTPDGFEEDFGGSAVVERSRLARVYDVPLVEKVVVS